MLEIVRLYIAAMRFANSKYGRAHWCDVANEWHEYTEYYSFDELCDVLHTVIRLTGSVYLGLVVWPCVVKFARRYAEYGDIRSKRNLEKKGGE